MARTIDKTSNEIKFRITAGYSLLPEPITAVARLDQTWYQFLTKSGVKLFPVDIGPIRVKSQNSVEWFAELTEEVRKVSPYYNSKRSDTHSIFLYRRQDALNRRVIPVED